MPFEGVPIVPGISYARISSEKQVAGEGLARQLQAAHEWIAKHPVNVRLDLTLTDTARSAYKGEHLADGEFGKLLETRSRTKRLNAAPCYSWKPLTA